jgi:TonB family protein
MSNMPEPPSASGSDLERSALYRPPWLDAREVVPWYQKLSRLQWLGLVAFIAALHGFFIWGFFQDTKFSQAEALRNRQKLMTNYQTLPGCFGARVEGEVLKPIAPLAVPEMIAAIGLKGTVGLGIRLKPDGTVAASCLAETSGNPGLDNAIHAAARDWKFNVPSSRPEVRRMLMLRIAEAQTPINISAWAPAAKIKPEDVPPQKNKPVKR